MGHKCDYGAVKATELKIVAIDIAEATGRDWKDITFWIDKCCIPQRHPLMPICLQHLEDFVQRCDGMVVLLSWQYFERLWCVYEWASFLVYHRPENVQICVEAFLRPSSRALYVDAIKNFSVASAKCYHEADRTVLKTKVAQYYNSEEDFENFARSTAIALVARSACHRASRGPKAYEADYMPFVRLAQELKLTKLADALASADPGKWRRQALGGEMCGTLGKAAKSWQKEFWDSIGRWFSAHVSPVLTEIKVNCVKANFKV